MKDKTTAAILSLLLGGLGVHKFYLGKGVWGLLYLVFCWTFIPAIIGLLEGILLLLMSQREFDAKYNQIPGLAPAVAGLAQLHAKPSMSRVETLQALQNLRESGALSEAEFDREKKLLLASNRS